MGNDRPPADGLATRLNHNGHHPRHHPGTTPAAHHRHSRFTETGAHDRTGSSSNGAALPPRGSRSSDSVPVSGRSVALPLHGTQRSAADEPGSVLSPRRPGGGQRRESGVRPMERPAVAAGVRAPVRDALVAETRADATARRTDRPRGHGSTAGSRDWRIGGQARLQSADPPFCSRGINATPAPRGPVPGSGSDVTRSVRGVSSASLSRVDHGLSSSMTS